MLKKIKKFLGMRTIKTGISVSLALMVTSTYTDEVAFFAVIGAIVGTERTLAKSLFAGLGQLVGTLLGTIGGMLFAYFAPPGNMFLVGIVLIFVIAVCNLLKSSFAVVNTSIVFVSIALGLIEGTAITYGIDRAIDTTVGVAMAILVNIVFFPYNNSKKIYALMYETEKAFLTLLTDRLFHGKIVHMEDYHYYLDEFKAEVELFSGEVFRKKQRKAQSALFFTYNQLLSTMYYELTAIFKMDAIAPAYPDNIDKLVGFGAEVPSDYEYSLSSTELEETVLNFHLSNFLEAYSYLQDMKDMD